MNQIAVISGGFLCRNHIERQTSAPRFFQNSIRVSRFSAKIHSTRVSKFVEIKRFACSKFRSRSSSIRIRPNDYSANGWRSNLFRSIFSVYNLFIYLFIFNLSRKLGITNERNESNFSNNIIAQGVRTILTNYVFIELTDFN